MDNLRDKNCISCEGDGGNLSPLSQEDINKFLLELGKEWEIVDGYLEKKFKFSNFKKGLSFTNEIGKISEEQEHHPIIELSWGKVIVRLKTVKVKDISINDFILAAKFDDIR